MPGAAGGQGGRRHNSETLPNCVWESRSDSLCRSLAALLNYEKVGINRVTHFSFKAT